MKDLIVSVPITNYFDRKLGLGRRLVEQVIEHARSIGCSRVYLTTTSAQESAVRLYLRMGFVNNGEDEPGFGERAWFRYTKPLLGAVVLKFNYQIPS